MMMIVICSWLKNYKIDWILSNIQNILLKGSKLEKCVSDRKSIITFIVILGSLTAFGPLAIDMFYLDYLILVMILIFLHLQLSLLSPFYDWVSVRKFLAGPISDITGRKPLIFSLIILLLRV